MTIREAYDWYRRNGSRRDDRWHAARWAIWWAIGWRWTYPGRAA